MSSLNRSQIAAIVVAALGYFVDVYDLLLFSIVRVASLESLGYSGEALLMNGVFILNAQMAGMLVGGVLWGVWGDKRGRLSVLFGSIFMYSAANLANAFVHDVNAYAILRFIAGVGLAGELGAGITLVSEIMPKDKRGLATTIVATVGVMGAIAAALVGDYFPWRTAFMIGGVLGFLLLVLRISVKESGMYENVSREENVRKGDFLMLIRSGTRLKRYLSSILAGLPIWCVLGILVTFSPELGRAMGVAEPVSAGRSVFYAYVGLVLGDLGSGLLSQYLRSRKKVLALFISLTGLFGLIYFVWPHTSPTSIYFWCVPVGFAVGYWAVFITAAAEQFGTNLRATVSTTAPNFVRGAVVPLTAAFELFRRFIGIVGAGVAVLALSVVIALWAIRQLEDTFDKDLDFVEYG